MSSIMERTEIISNDFKDWPNSLIQELKNCNNTNVGLKLLKENDQVKIWSINLQPGERIPFHKHIRTYFWVAHTIGNAISRFGDGTIKSMSYEPDDMAYFVFENGDYMVHDLENTGNTPLIFTTVELLS